MQSLESHFAKNLPFAAYRNPGDGRVTAFLQQDRKLYLFSGAATAGFIMAPFLSGSTAVVIRPDTVCTYDSPRGREIQNIAYPADIDSQEDKRAYLSSIEKAKENIEKGVFEKVVLSRKLEIATRAHPVGVFSILLQAYPDAFCYLWYHPETGSWLGASPELLLRVQGDSFMTTALAGTLKYKESHPPHWSRKEQREQALVTGYIGNILKAKAVAYLVSEAESVRAGGLWHLRSAINGLMGTMSAEGLLKALHPTPAVGGLPLREALEFIAGIEGYDRSFYTGYMGVVSRPIPDKSDPSLTVYVNLRCMHLQHGLALIYVGAGITAESVPEQEWQETCDKAGTMFRVLFNSGE